MEEVTKAIIEMMDYIVNLHKKEAIQADQISVLTDRVEKLEKELREVSQKASCSYNRIAPIGATGSSGDSPFGMYRL